MPERLHTRRAHVPVPVPVAMAVPVMDNSSRCWADSIRTEQMDYLFPELPSRWHPLRTQTTESTQQLPDSTFS